MHRDKNVSSSHELSNKQKKIKIGPLVAEKQTFREAIWRPSLMAAILVFYTDFQVAPPLESYLLASTKTTESGTFQSKSAAFSGVPDVLLVIYPIELYFILTSTKRQVRLFESLQ